MAKVRPHPGLAHVIWLASHGFDLHRFDDQIKTHPWPQSRSA